MSADNTATLQDRQTSSIIMGRVREMIIWAKVTAMYSVCMIRGVGIESSGMIHLKHFALTLVIRFENT